MALKVLIGVLFLVSQTEEVRRYKYHSNDLNVYQFVSVGCIGGLHDSGYSITFRQKVYFKEANSDGKIGKVCMNR